MEETDIERKYRVERSTQYGDYVALVSVDKHTRKQTIELYDGEPNPGFLASLFGIEQEPIAERTIGPFTDVEKTIAKMIVEYELPYYQKEKTLKNDHYLIIDYEAELRKRKPKPKDPMLDEVSIQKDLYVNDYELGQYVVTPRGKTVNLNSIKNLKQYR